MELLSQKGVRFTAKNIAEDSKAREELTQWTGRMSVPMIVVNGKVVVGFDRGRLGSPRGSSDRVGRQGDGEMLCPVDSGRPDGACGPPEARSPGGKERGEHVVVPRPVAEGVDAAIIRARATDFGLMVEKPQGKRRRGRCPRLPHPAFVPYRE
ncbi:MAG: glutaredoxin family protein [Candidatus Methylomirabilales bacterium]